jgi:hypothetical protein
MKRDIASEIARYRSRLIPGHGRFPQELPRLGALDALRQHAEVLANQKNPLAGELIKYFPIGYISCVESMARLIFRDLLDSVESREPVVRGEVFLYGPRCRGGP